MTGAQSYGGISSTEATPFQLGETRVYVKLT